MDYKEWCSFKKGDRVKHRFEGAGTIITNCGVGYVVQFDNGKVERISNGNLYKIVSRKELKY